MTTQSTIPLFMLRLVHAGLCLLFISSLSASTVFAQSDHPSDPFDGDAIAVAELAQMLASPDDAERSEALFRVTQLAHYTPGADLTPTVSALVDIYQNHPVVKFRFAAVSALHAIGDETGMQGVREHALEEPSLSVQYVSIAALLDYYGPNVFGNDAEAVALANNVLVRKNESSRLARVRPDAPVVARNQ